MADQPPPADSTPPDPTAPDSSAAPPAATTPAETPPTETPPAATAQAATPTTDPPLVATTTAASPDAPPPATAAATAPPTEAAAAPTAAIPADAAAPGDVPAPAVAAQAPAEASAAASATAAPAVTAPDAQAAADGADDAAISQESIDALLKQANFEAPEGAEGDGKNPSIDQLLQQANFEDGAAVASELPGSDAEAFKLPSFQQVMADAQVSSIDLLRDVELNVKIELGRSRMLVEEVLKLAEGSVVELDKLAGDPVDVFVNERLVARGEVLVLNDNFCVRVNEIVAAIKEEGP